jgi:hypothetical protein
MSAKSSIVAWSLPRLQPLLELPEDSLKEVISYAVSLPDADQVSSHFKVISVARARVVSLEH